jgi:hypothetical protein
MSTGNNGEVANWVAIWDTVREPPPGCDPEFARGWRAAWKRYRDDVQRSLVEHGERTAWRHALHCNLGIYCQSMRCSCPVACDHTRYEVRTSYMDGWNAFVIDGVERVQRWCVDRLEVAEPDQVHPFPVVF